MIKYEKYSGYGVRYYGLLHIIIKEKYNMIGIICKNSIL